MTTETTLRLSEIDNIVGVKEASSDATQITSIIDGAPDDFHVWSGNDDETFSIMCVGGYGIVSVASNVIGSQIQTMIQNILSGSISKAAENHRYLLPFFKAIFWVTNPAPIKYAVNKAGFKAGPLRLPMFEVDETFKAQFDPLIEVYKIDLPV
tara:strand:- start:45 stop:503 length:459 start_codon:yes stop_codon:yes gene_type:complete